MSSLQYVLNFDGTDDYMSVPDSPSLQTLSYTVEVWIKPKGKPNEEWKGIIGKPGRNYHIWIHNAGYVHHRFHAGQSTNAGAPNTPNGSLKWDQWNHLAITNDGTTAKTYINGDLQAEGPTGGALVVHKTPLYVARSLDEAVGRYFKGQMADIRVWNQVRSPEEIKNCIGQRLKGNEPGLAAYWPLNEGTGTTVIDKTSNANVGTLHGATWTQESLDFLQPATTEQQILQSVASFDGSNDYIEVPYKKELNPAQFTLSCWAKVEGGQGQWRSPVTCRTAKGSSALGGYLLYAGNNNKWQFWTGNGGWVGLHGADVVLNTWTHVAATYDGSTMKLYINGQLSGTPVPSKILINTQYPLRIGAGITEGNPGFFFNGKITEVRLWDRARSPEEIQASMHQRLRGDEEGLVAYWPLNQESGTSAEDQTGKGNPGTLQGSTWTQESLDCIQPSAAETEQASEQSVLMFDGQDDYIPTTLDAQPSALPNTTWEAWVKPTRNINHWDMILSTDDGGWDRFVGVNGGQFRVSHGKEAWNPVKAEINQWQHIAVVYSADKQIKFYKNGTEYIYSGQSSIGSTKLPFHIGRSAGIGDQYFQGFITEVRVWDSARTAEEIQNNMNRRLTGNEPGLVGYWPLSEGQGTTGADQSNHGYDSIINGARWETSSLELSPASAVEPAPAEPSEAPSTETTILTFDGVDDYVEIPANATLDVIDNFTIEAWIKPEVLGKRIIDKNIGGQSEGFTFDTYPQNLRFINKGIAFTSRTPLKTGTWQHVAVTFKHEANGAKLYINGAVDNTATPSRVGTVTKLPVRLGSQADALGNLFKGEMAEVRIWNRVRSPEEIQASMNQRLAGDEEGLIGYWPLNEGTGTTAEDNTGNCNAGMIHGGTWATSALSLSTLPETSSARVEDVSLTSPAKESSRSSDLMFDGVDDYVQMPSSEWEAPAFSVELWAKASQKQANYASVISTSDNPSQKGSFQIDTMGGYYRFCHTDIQARIGKVNQDWQHLAVTYDGSMVKTYLNGEEQYSKAIDSMSTLFRNYQLGRNRNGDKYFAGELTDIRIWNRALTPEEIQGNMGSRLIGNETGLVAYWPLDEGTGEALADKTGHTRPGTIYGATWQHNAVEMKPVETVSGAVRQEGNTQFVLSFDGKTDTIETDCKLNFRTQAFTVEAWVYSTGRSGVILSAEKHGASAYQFRLVQEKNTIAFMLSDRAGNDLLWDSKQGYLLQSTVAENEWFHIAVKRIGTTHQLYVDGRLASECETDRVIDWQNSLINLRIGAQNAYSGNGGIFYFQGKVADVRIWNRERFQEEIQTQKNSGLSGQESGLVGYWPLNEGNNQVSDRTGNSSTILQGGTWEQETVGFGWPGDLPIVNPTHLGLTGDEPELLQYWPLNQGAKGLQIDSLMDVPTQPQTTLTFDGSSTYIETDYQLNLGLAPFTLEAWVYSTGKSGVILSSEKHGVSAYQFRLIQDKNTIAFMLSDRPGNHLLWESKRGYLLQSTVIKDEWSHIAIKRVGTSHQMYVNGILTCQCETSQPIDWDTSNVPLRIGAQRPYSGEGGIFYFPGQVADIRIWNIERSVEEIQTQRQYQLTGKEGGLVGYWPLNEGDTQVSDLTGNSTATLYGGTWEQQDLRFLQTPLVDEAQSPSGAIVPASSANVIPKTDQPEDLNLDLDFDKSVIGITILTDTNHVGGKPKTIYGKEQKKKRKKRKKQNKYLSPLEKLVRDVAKRQDKATRTYFERHKRSNRKKKNGWIKDLVKNTTKSWEKLF